MPPEGGGSGPTKQTRSGIEAFDDVMFLPARRRVDDRRKIESAAECRECRTRTWE
jgi:hypothetical protein